MPSWALHLRAPAGPARLLGGQRHADQVEDQAQGDALRVAQPAWTAGVEHVLADSTAGFRLAVLACLLLEPRVRA